MAMPAEELNALVFYDPEGPLAKELTAVPEDPEEKQDMEIKGTWALACTGEFIWPIPDKGLSRRIHRVTAPTLIVWGKQDGLVPPVYAEEFASRLKDARVEMIDKAGHVAQLEQVTRLVTDFLRQ